MRNFETTFALSYEKIQKISEPLFIFFRFSGLKIFTIEKKYFIARNMKNYYNFKKIIIEKCKQKKPTFKIQRVFMDLF